MGVPLVLLVLLGVASQIFACARQIRQHSKAIKKKLCTIGTKAAGTGSARGSQCNPLLEGETTLATNGKGGRAICNKLTTYLPLRSSTKQLETKKQEEGKTSIGKSSERKAKRNSNNHIAEIRFGKDIKHKDVLNFNELFNFKEDVL